MKQIFVNSKKNGQKIIMVDDSDYNYLNQFTWIVYRTKNTFYAYRVLSRKLNNGKQVKVSMHREILGLTDKSLQADHIDHDGLNNQRKNLRKATPAQNTYNRTSHAGSSSKYKGVQFTKCKSVYNGKEKIYYYWKAMIGINNKVHTIGTFKSEAEAAAAYNKKAVELHGEFANLNKVA